MRFETFFYILCYAKLNYERTSGIKTSISELLIWQQLLTYRKNALVDEANSSREKHGEDQGLSTLSQKYERRNGEIEGRKKIYWAR